MSLHSRNIIHWTGRKNINPQCKAMDNDLRQEYVKWLKEICQKGLYMNPGEELIYGIGKKWIKASISRVCFTEIRLSQTQQHATRYGDLGIGFNREFILEREGNPVFYVQNGDKGHVIENFDCLHGYIDFITKNILNIEKFLSKHIDDKEIKSIFSTLSDIHNFVASSKTKLKELEVILGYLKNMSDINSPDLMYYEEMEWRIVHLDRFEGRYISVEDRTNNIFWLNLKPEDIKILIFPDSLTQDLALKDNFIINFFDSHLPMITTLKECGNF